MVCCHYDYVVIVQLWVGSTFWERRFEEVCCLILQGRGFGESCVSIALLDSNLYCFMWIN